VAQRVVQQRLVGASRVIRQVVVATTGPFQVPYAPPATQGLDPATPVVIISDFLGTVAVTFWYAWLFNHSGGSVLLTLISHDVEGVIHPQLFWTDPAVGERVTLIYAAAWCAVAIAVVVFDRRHWRRIDGATSATRAGGSYAEDATDQDDDAIMSR
jgi:hypothetical protein